MPHKRTRVAIYARYSSDLQNPASIEDQIALCTSLMEKQFSVSEPVAIFSDAAISGATSSRPGLQSMLDAADNRQFDVLVAEGLDRISRSLSDIASIYEVLQHCGIKIWTGHEGAVSDLHVGFKGTMNALFLRDMKDKVRRAHKSIAASGRAPAGIAYGYRAVRGVLDEKGRYINGLREIHPEQADVIRRIFMEYADGVPLRQIVKSLNNDGVPSPSGKLWRVHSISGEASRHRGILHNDLYRGVMVYNRMRKVVDPRTGKRKYVMNPRDEWVTKPVPELRIVSDEMWAKVHVLRSQVRLGPRKERVQKKRIHVPEPIGSARPLTGLITCGWCGGMKQVANHTRYVCVTHRFEHKCKNSRGWREDALAATVLASLDTFVDQVSDWQPAMQEALSREQSSRMQLEREAEVLDRRISRLFDALEMGVKMDWKRLRQLQDRRDEIKSLPPVPDFKAEHREIKQKLSQALDAIRLEWGNRKYAAPIRDLLKMTVRKVVCTPIKGKSRGETVDVQLKPVNEWGAFYTHIHANWPHIDEKKPVVRQADYITETSVAVRGQ